LDPRVSQACVEIGVALGDEDSVRAAIDAAVAALAGRTSTKALQAPGARLTTLAEAASPQDAAAAAAVLTALGKPHDPEAMPVLGQALARLAERGPLEQAPAMAFAGTSARLLPTQEVQAIRKYNDTAPDLLRARREFMRPLAARLSPEDAAASAQA